MPETYEEMLTKVYSKLPARPVTGERFVMPAADILVIGSQTIFKNFAGVAAALRREPRHLLKWLSRELAAPANLSADRALFQARIPQRSIQAKLEAYVKEFVLCRECKRPDTRLEKTERITTMACEACGARATVKQI